MTAAARPFAARVLLQGGHAVVVRRMEGVERVGEPFLFDVEVFSTDPIHPAEILAKPCALVLEGEHDGRVIAGTVSRVTRQASRQAREGRVLGLRVEPAVWALRLLRRCRIFRKQTVPQIVQQVLAGAGYAADAITLPSGHPPREHVTQLDETDLEFLQRMCEEEGLHLLYGVDPHHVTKEHLQLADTSTTRQPAGPPLVVVGGGWATTARPAAFHLALREARRPGTSTVSDYDHENPDVKLQASVAAGNAVEKATEIYRAPAGFSSAGEGKALALRRLEAERMTASVLVFSTNAVGLQVGGAVKLEDGDGKGGLDVAGVYVVTRIHSSGHTAERAGRTVCEAIPVATPVRLPLVTPKTRIAGLDVARVCGAPGAEIHPDSLGRVRLYFPWDIDGTTDHTSSLPVRVAQPQMPGSMNIPRVSWQQYVAFEDGDPDRPFAVGRGYTATHGPPFSLPTNKQITAMRSHSSPGGGGMNSIHMDDGAGKQHFVVSAQSAQNVKVGADAVVSTEKKERETAASQTRHVGANQKISVTELFVTNAASQSLTVAAKHSVYTGGNLAIGVGGELVGVGGALLEKIGNPAAGAAALGKQALLAAPGVAGGLVGGLGGMVIGIGGGIAGVAYGAVQASEKGQSVGASLLSGGLDMVGGFVPGGSAVLGGIKRAGGDRYPWDPPPAPEGPAAAGGGAGAGAGGGGGAGGPGPGYKNEHVKGAYSEVIGGAFVVATPGKIAWETQGGELFNVGASHTVRSALATKNVGGASTESSSAFHVKAGSKVHRQVNGAITTTIGGAYSITSKGGKVSFDAGAALTFKAASLELEGGKVTFQAGDAVVSLSSDGLLIKASNIEINGETNISGDVTH